MPNDPKNENEEISFDKNKKGMPDEKDGLKEDKNSKELYSKYKNFKWKEPEKLKNGPLGDESR